MAHATARSGYRDLVERLNRFPQGAPPSDLLYRILALPPVKRALASEQVRSVYLERLIERAEGKL